MSDQTKNTTTVVQIYLDDLTPAKQQEIIKAAGGKLDEKLLTTPIAIIDIEKKGI